MTRREQLLTILAADARPIDPIRIMKSLFLFTQDALKHRLPAQEELFDFRPLHYGPCAPAVYGELDALDRDGLIHTIDVPGGTWKKYQITPRGAVLAPRDESGAAEHLRALRRWAEQLSFSDLLRSVYRLYPDYATNAVLSHLRPSG